MTGHLKPRLNPAQLGLLIDQYLAGKTVYELGSMFGINRQTVAIILKREGVPMRRQGIGENLRDEVVSLRNLGWPFARLGERFGENPSTVRNFLLRGSHV